MGDMIVKDLLFSQEEKREIVERKEVGSMRRARICEIMTASG
jgi:hypothetical protein